MIALSRSLLLLSFLSGILGAVVWQMFDLFLHWFLDFLVKKSGPPVELSLLAQRLRERAAYLEHLSKGKSSG